MRTFSRVVLASFAVALVAGPALAQRGPQRGGPGGGGPDSLIRMLMNKSVQKELSLDEADVAKVPEAVMKALEGVLKPEQMKRLKQIELQMHGAGAFHDAKVQTALKITDEQKEKIKSIQEDAGKEIRELFTGGGRDFRANGEKMQKINKETMKKTMGVLSPEQKKAWRDMVGEPFEMKREQRPMGRPRANRNAQ
jgi:hypothetical protein